LAVGAFAATDLIPFSMEDFGPARLALPDRLAVGGGQNEVRAGVLRRFPREAASLCEFFRTDSIPFIALAFVS